MTSSHLSGSPDAHEVLHLVPFAYRVEADSSCPDDSCIVYSVGENGIDDGGSRMATEIPTAVFFVEFIVSDI